MPERIQPPPEPPYRWHPTHTEHPAEPEVGKVIPWRHKAWRIIDVYERAEIDWKPEDRQRLAHYKPEYRHKYRPRVVRIRPVDRADAHADVHLPYGGARAGLTWHQYADDHYPICATCGDPLPCRDQMAQRLSADAAARMNRWTTTGVCPSCGEVVTQRQKARTFPENLELPGGPPVTFHDNRRACRYAGDKYAARVGATDDQLVLGGPQDGQP